MISLTSFVWLASYPKSGNTWTRIFLTNYLRNSDTPALINELDDAMIASARSPLNAFYGIDSTDLTLDQVDTLRPDMYRHWMASSELQFHKTHDGYTYLPDGQPLLGPPAGQSAIYLIRNPLDVALSYAHHSARDEVAGTITHMAESNFSMCRKSDRFELQLRQQMGSWSDHVRSWQGASFPVLIVRYEDMIQDPLGSFTRMVTSLGLENDEARIQRAIQFSSFDEVKRQESEKGFREKNVKSTSFFRKGESGSYREVLTDSQIASICDTHRDVMTEFGYL